MQVSSPPEGTVRKLREGEEVLPLPPPKGSIPVLPPLGATPVVPQPPTGFVLDSAPPPGLYARLEALMAKEAIEDKSAGGRAAKPPLSSS